MSQQLPSTSQSTTEFAQQIKARAAELGFAACGITTAAPGETHGHFVDWIRRGYHATMQWIARDDVIAKRADVRLVVPGAKSVICVAMHYRTREEWDAEQHGKIARYARGADYHDFMTPRLRELQSWIQEQQPCNGRVYVDTGPVLERELARRAGIGWVGKNTMVMSRELGSYFLLGEIILDLELPADRPHIEQYCGSCTRCLDACPTGAFEAPYVLNANKCISFHTIENRSLFPKELNEKFGDWFFGCDVCQEVCPWNGKSTHVSAEPELWTRPQYASLFDVMTMPQDEFSRTWKGSPLKRAKRRGLKRNALAVLKNRRRKYN
ncbi:MAG TPA: tRNA epoxyqueuosine(34) reductase QueG [Abditibacteriaceae bacterium]